LMPLAQLVRGRSVTRLRRRRGSAPNYAWVRAVMRSYHLPEPVSEYVFHPTRRWRLDFAWPDVRLGLEIQGGLFVHGRHTRGAALRREHEKLNELAVAGWRVVFVVPEQLTQAATYTLLRRALGM